MDMLKHEHGAARHDLTAADLRELVTRFKAVYASNWHDFRPQSGEQLERASSPGSRGGQRPRGEYREVATCGA